MHHRRYRDRHDIWGKPLTRTFLCHLLTRRRWGYRHMNQLINNRVETSISMDIIQLIDFAIAERLTRRSTSWATHYQSGDRPCNDGPCPGRIAHRIRGILTLTMFSECYCVEQIVGYRLKSDRVA